MLDIYAASFRIATRTDCIPMRGLTKAKQKRRWLPTGHWWLNQTKCIDPSKI